MTSDTTHRSVEGAETSATSAFGTARLLLAAEHAVNIGAASLRQGRSHIGALNSKGDRDFAHDVDLLVEVELRACLASATPEIPIRARKEAEDRMWQRRLGSLTRSTAPSTSRGIARCARSRFRSWLTESPCWGSSTPHYSASDSRPAVGAHRARVEWPRARAQAAADATGVDVAVEVSRGRPADALMQLGQQVDLLVIGSRPRRASVADELRPGRVFPACTEPEGMSRTVAFACVLAVGGVIALQPPANAALAQHVGDLGAALISAAITVTILAVLLLVFSEPARLSGLVGFKPQYAIGGVGGAAVVAVSLVAVRPLGVAGVVSLLVAGQLVISVLADRLGWFGVAQVGLTPGRLAGVFLVALGTLLITRP